MFVVLFDYFCVSYLDVIEVYLMVNCKNLRVWYVYLMGGWVDMGELYFDGGYGF